MGKKKFDQDKAKRRLYKKIIADPETMNALTQVAAFNRRIAELQEQLYALVVSVDQSELFFKESLKWTAFGKALPLQSYTINDEYWWEYGDNSHEYDAKALARNLALYASLMERDGVGA